MTNANKASDPVRIMWLRDEYAGKAMAAIVSVHSFDELTRKQVVADIAEISWEIADAMLKARGA
jgi:hypothetical protein